MSRPQGSGFAGGDAQLDQGHQSPMGSCPFAVRMDAEPAVPALARQQRPHHGTVEDLVGVDVALAEQISLGQ